MKRLALLLLPVFGVLLMSHNVGAINGWANIRNFRLNSSGLSSSNPTDHGWFSPVSYSPTITSGYARLYNPVLTIDGNASTLPKGHDFRIYIIGNATSRAVSSIGYSPFETDVLAVYTGNFVCFDDDISISNNSGGSFDSSSNIYQYNFSFVHKLSCRTTGNFTVNDLHLAGLLLKYNVIYNNSNLAFKLDLQGKIVWYDDPNYDALTTIDDKLSNINSDTTDIVDTLGEINDKLDKLNSNADKNSEAWNNMQNTDGLVDIGDDSQLLSIVGTITTVFDSIKNAPMSESCTISSGNTPINMGDINLCYPLPQWVQDIGAFVMTSISFVAVLFMLIGCVNAVNKFMDWARSN